MVDHDHPLPDSAVYELQATPRAGRGLFALSGLKSGTHILTTSPALSPIAHVILRQYRREVCANCFAYDRGQNWKHRIPQTALSFCSSACLEYWTGRSTPDQRQALTVLEASIQRQQRQNAEQMNICPERPITWNIAEQTGTAIIQARSRTLSKKDRRLVATHVDARIDADIATFLLSGCFMHQSNTSNVSSLMTLADNPSVYNTASLPEHAQAYLHLLAILPPSLLSQLRPDISHDLISRASHNAFSIRPPSSSDGEQSGEFLGYGVWPEASFFNHSCAPNVSKKRVGRQWTFTTSRDIAEGEELCITYLGGDERDFDVQGRRKRLHDEWGFTCQCQKCIEEAG